MIEFMKEVTNGYSSSVSPTLAREMLRRASEKAMRVMKRMSKKYLI